MTDDDWFYFLALMAALATIIVVLGVSVVACWLLELGRFA